MTPGNQVRWSLVEGINPVFGTFKPDLELPEDMTCVDIQLVAGPCLEDVDFITDYSEPNPRGGNLRRYCSLPDRLGTEAVSRLRDRLAHALSDISKRTSCGGAWVLWGTPLTEQEDADYVPHYNLSGWCDSASINGSMSIFGCERNDLLWYRHRFCDFDGFAGLASPTDEMGLVLSLLTLDSPWPSTRAYRAQFAQRVDSVESLRRLLATEGTFFFEEVYNGTRLRLVSLRLTRERLMTAIEPHLDDPSRTPRRSRTQFTVDWPVQGLAYFRSSRYELVLSDVYWMWIFEALGHLSGECELGVPFLVAWEEGFSDPSSVVEKFPVAEDLLVLLGAVAPSMAPSFELVKPTGGCAVTAERILEEFGCVVREAVADGSIEVEIE